MKSVIRRAIAAGLLVAMLLIGLGGCGENYGRNYYYGDDGNYYYGGDGGYYYGDGGYYHGDRSYYYRGDRDYDRSYYRGYDGRGDVGRSYSSQGSFSHGSAHK